MARRPKAGVELTAAFEAAVANGHAYEFLSNGILACLENIASLTDEFSFLASHGSNARAQFVMATAMEEVGKALILFDLVRIPWDNKDRVAGLCRAFYNHLRKAAYARTIYWPGNGSLEAALELFKLELIEYWPNRDPESGEPDEYAAALVNREWGLYVDWNSYDGRWLIPQESSLAYFYAQEKETDGRTVGQARIEDVLFPLLRARDEKLFSPRGLEIVHSIMRDIDAKPTTPEQQIIDAIQSIAEQLASNGIKLSDETVRANFMLYPLYAAILNPESIKGY